MVNIPLIKGKEADVIAERLGLRRKKVFWFIKESDKSLRSRMLNRVQQISNSNLRPIHCKVCKGGN